MASKAQSFGLSPAPLRPDFFRGGSSSGQPVERVSSRPLLLHASVASLQHLDARGGLPAYTPDTVERCNSTLREAQSAAKGQFSKLGMDF